MDNWKDCLLGEDAKILDAARVIDSTFAKIAIIVNKENVLLGCVTDYDVRKAVLRGISMSETSVNEIMSKQPKTALEGLSDTIIHKMFLYRNVRQLPIVNRDNIVCGLKTLWEYETRNIKRANPVVLMAGGLGTRLRPLTDNCPKPLLKIGGKPILEIILENFIQQGFYNFYISVNYKAEMIEKYFGDGSNYSVSINYLKENKRLGTAGALSLLPESLKEAVIVMNGDLLTKVDFNQLLDYHIYRNADATMCVREYSYQVPYGVIDIDNLEIKMLREKPSYTFFVNAGMYVLQPDIIKEIPHDTFFDMTDLFNLNIQKKKRNLAFPIREYWIDVGRMEDFERASEEFF